MTNDTSDMTLWTTIEGNPIIITACITTLRPLFELIFNKRSQGSYDPTIAATERKRSITTSNQKSGIELSRMDRKEGAPHQESEESILRGERERQEGKGEGV